MIIILLVSKLNVNIPINMMLLYAVLLLYGVLNVFNKTIITDVYTPIAQYRCMKHIQAYFWN